MNKVAVPVIIFCLGMSSLVPSNQALAIENTSTTIGTTAVTSGKLIDSPYSIKVPTQKDPLLYIPNQYSFFPRFTSDTKISYVVSGTARTLPASDVVFQPNTITPGAEDTYLEASKVGIYNSRWVDLRLIPLELTSPITVGHAASTFLRFTNTGTTSDPIVKIQYLDHETKQPVDVSGFFTYTDIDNAESLKIFKESNMQNIYVMEKSTLLYSDDGTSTSITSGGVASDEFVKESWGSFIYGPTDHLIMAPRAAGTSVIGYIGKSLVPIDFPKPQFIADEATSNVEDNQVEYTTIQEVPYRDTDDIESKLVMKTSLEDILDIQDVKITDISGKDASSLFTMAIDKNTNTVTATATSTALKNANLYSNSYMLKVTANLKAGADYDSYLKNKHLEIPAVSATELAAKTLTSDSAIAKIRIFDAPVLTASNLHATAGSISADIDWMSTVSAIDEVDGDVSDKVTVDYSAVNFKKEGDYPVTYTITNSKNKTATKTVTMTITADDPVIEATDLDIIAGTDENAVSWYTGASATDKVDGDLSSQLVADYSQVNFNKEGNYPVIYSVKNSNNKALTKTVTARVTANLPVITAQDINIIAGTAATDVPWYQNTSATDKVDGDISANLTVDYSKVNFKKEGQYPVTYTVENSNNKTTTKTIQVTVSADLPVLQATGLQLLAGTKAEDVAWYQDVTATDKADGDLSTEVTADYSAVNFKKEGTYPVVYTVTNSNNKTTAVTVTVTITADAPALGAANLDTLAGTKSSDILWFQGVFATDKADGDISKDVKVDYSQVNFNKEGSYPVVYSVTNSNNKTTSKTVNMNVTAENPVLQATNLATIAGTNPNEISWFQNVSATDRADGDISTDIKVDYSAVNFKKEGNYPVVYTITNSNNKTTTKTINITVTAEKPALQASNIDILAGTKAADIPWFQSVTALDRADGDISKDVTVDFSKVQFKKEGNYPVIYTVTNSNGKTSTSTVNLQVTAKEPVLTATDLDIIAGTDAQDIAWYQGVSAEDLADGDISTDITVNYDEVNFKKEGNYPAAYSVTNSNGKTTTTTINVHVTAENPVLHASDLAIIAGTKEQDIAWFHNVTAEDKADGNINDQIQIDYSSVDLNKEGNYPVTYTVTNSNNKITTQTVNIQVTAENPVIEASNISVLAGSTSEEYPWFQNVTATDKVDGDISQHVSVDYSQVDFNKEGNYPVSYTVTNSNDKETTITINLQVTAENPVITAVNKSILAGTKSEGISWFDDVFATDKVDGDLSSDVTVDYANVDFNKEGTYPVHYTVTNSNGKTTVETVQIEVTAEMAILKASNLTVMQGASEDSVAWLENVTAEDTVDGDIIDQVTYDASQADLTKAGNYPVVYSVTNSNNKTTTTTVNLQVIAPQLAPAQPAPEQPTPTQPEVKQPEPKQPIIKKVLPKTGDTSALLYVLLGSAFILFGTLLQRRRKQD
ncbi:LPXTG cell wall anchor domain-containing protein [Paenilisteria newyorkensis]|uniref:LPXTG cell wall anchor domain-containing protein n=1 Tax=Listeria newyorkensis TaxID=1497681 RepID=UPI000669EDBB|nr:immunoglobulin-like domain-containing protein [Listeria newyorkensis]KMT61647.1 putative peptidoglycan linked protein [Listeria newyorkensis]